MGTFYCTSFSPFIFKRNQPPLALWLLLLIFSGCSLKSQVVPLRAPTEAIENALQEANQEPIFQNQTILTQEWWLRFNDPQLNVLMEKTLIHNPSLQTARTRIFAAFYQAASVESALYPYISWDADVSRQKLSKTGVIPFNAGPTGAGTPTIEVPVVNPGSGPGTIPVYFTLYETEINLRYHFDFWDKQRNTFRAALGQLQARVAEEAFARLQLSVLVAQTYYALQIDYRRQEILMTLVESRSHYIDLIQQRIQSRVDNALSLQSAEVQLNEAKELLLQVEGDIAVKKNQLLAYLAGNFEEEILPSASLQQPLPQVPLPEQLPLNLVAQRPDIVAQLWLIESAGRGIEVAKAGFYPDFNLAAFFGFQTIHFAELFKWPSRYFNVDPAVSLPLFDGGRLIADLRSSEVNYDLAILDYNRLVINAAQEVLDAVAVLRNSAQRLEESAQKVGHLQVLDRLTRLRVSYHLNNRLDLLQSEETVFIAQDQETIALGNTMQALLELIRALGGGYDDCGARQ